MDPDTVVLLVIVGLMGSVFAAGMIDRVLRLNGFLCRRRHKKRWAYRKIYRKPESPAYRTVAVKHTEKRIQCKNCKKTFSDWQDVRQESFTGLQWPTEMYDIFQETGEYEDSQWISEREVDDV